MRQGQEDFFLVLGQFVPYKRVDLAVEAFNRLGRRLVVIGDGPEKRRLHRLARGNITFLGWQDNTAVRTYLSSCRALIFPGEEDFGIVPLEAQMAGRPVIAFGKGGALETVLADETGLFFSVQEPESLVEAVRRFERDELMFRSDRIRQHALRFEKREFIKQFDAYVRSVLRNG